MGEALHEDGVGVLVLALDDNREIGTFVTHFEVVAELISIDRFPNIQFLASSVFRSAPGDPNER